MVRGYLKPFFGGVDRFISVAEEHKRYLVEREELPPEKVAVDVAKRCNISTRGVYLLAASVASLVGTVQVPARMIESALHKMLSLGFDVRGVVSAYGTCPLPPLAHDPLRAIGLANDAVLYGGRCWLTMQTDDALIEAMLAQRNAASAASGARTRRT